MNNILALIISVVLGVPFIAFAPVDQPTIKFVAVARASTAEPTPTVNPTATPAPTIVPTIQPAQPSSRSERARAIQPANEIEQFILEAADRYNIPRDVALATATQESGFDPNAVSRVGASGVMQVMPDTARSLTNPDTGQPFTPEDMFNPRLGALAGMQYLRRQWDKFESLELALAAYNAGPQAVIDYSGIPPYAETQHYVANILALKDKLYDVHINRPTLDTFASGYAVTQSYDQGNHAGSGNDNGIDLIPNDPTDTTVLATFDGTVVEVVNQPALCGNGVIIVSPSKLWKVLDCHLASVTVSVGQSVTAGSPIGIMGSTGAATGPHVHHSTQRLLNGAYQIYNPHGAQQ